MSGLTLLGALLLDGAMGEPRQLWSRVPHPAVLMGRAVEALEARMNYGDNRRAKGVLAVAVLVIGALVLGRLLGALGWPVELIVAAILLAQRSLVDHIRDVAAGLRVSLPAGREAVARIVSRDTAAMDEPQVARAAIESAAENLSDGVVAPAFWFLLFGLPGLIVYKVINTADSTIGYRTPRFEEFGWAAARLDDLLNLLPARLTGFILAALATELDRWDDIAADAKAHRSPNAGWPEAAMARALDVALAGPRSYDGQMRELAWVHPDGRRDIGAHDIDGAAAMLWRAWRILLIVAAAVALVGALPILL